MKNKKKERVIKLFIAIIALALISVISVNAINSNGKRLLATAEDAAISNGDSTEPDDSEEETCDASLHEQKNPSGEKGCICTPGYHDDGTGACEKDCLGENEVDDGNGTCECIEGYEKTTADGVCTKIVEDESLESEDEEASVRCGKNQKFDKDRNECVCANKSYTKMSTNECVKAVCNSRNNVLKVGKSKNLSYTLKGATKTYNKSYSIKNTNIATIDSNGKLTAKKAGQTAVTISLNGKEVWKCYVKVVKKKATAAQIEEAKAKLVMDDGNYDLKKTVGGVSSGGVNCGKTKQKVTKVTCKNVTISVGKKKKVKPTVNVKPACSNPNYTINITNKNGKKTNSKIAGKNGLNVYGKKKGTAYYVATSKGKNKKGKVVKSKVCKITVKDTGSSKKKEKKKDTKKQSNKVTKLTVSPTNIKIKVKEKKTIISRVLPAKANQKVTYKSKNSKIAKVNANGQVTGVKKGNTTITVTSKANKKYSKKVKVTVTSASKKDSNKVPVKSISVTPQTVQLVKGAKKKIKITYNPLNTTQKSVTYKSSKPSNVSVDSDGTINGLKSDVTATITITSKSNPKVKAKVKVVKGENVSEVYIIPYVSTYKIEKGETAQLNAVIKPITAASTKVKWSSENKNVATINSNGVVTGKKVGTTYIHAKSKIDETKKDLIKIKVEPKTKDTVKITKLNLKDVSIGVNEYKQAYITYEPGNSKNSKVKWSVSDTKIATVDSKGMVTGRKVGTTTLVATNRDGSVKAESTITVTKKVTANKIVSSIEADYIPIGGYVKIKTAFEPQDTSNKSLLYESSNEDIARVTKYGNIYGVSIGDAKIKITSVSNPKAVSYVKVSVGQVSKIDGIESNIVLTKIGSVKSIYSNVNLDPLNSQNIAYLENLASNIPNIGYKFVSSNKQVAVIDDYGVITSVGYGMSSIKILDASGKIIGYTKVVVNDVTGISCSDTQLEVGKSSYINNLKISSDMNIKENIKYSSNKSKIATVDSNGMVTAKKKGTTTIYVESKYNEKINAKCKVIVQNNGDAKKKDNSKSVSSSKKKDSSSGKKKDSSATSSDDKKDSSSGNKKGSSNSKEKYLFVGDSRFVGMRDTINSSKDKYFAEVGVGYSYLSQNEGKIKSLLSKVDYGIIGFGVNDLGNIDSYISKANKLGKEYDIYFLTVNPVDEEKERTHGYSVQNSSIDSFNKKLRINAEKYQVIDTNSYLKKNGYNTVDGVHYDSSTYKKIYNYIKSEIEK